MDLISLSPNIKSRKNYQAVASGLKFLSLFAYKLLTIKEQIVAVPQEKGSTPKLEDDFETFDISIPVGFSGTALGSSFSSARW